MFTYDLELQMDHARGVFDGVVKITFPPDFPRDVSLDRSENLRIDSVSQQSESLRFTTTSNRLAFQRLNVPDPVVVIYEGRFTHNQTGFYAQDEHSGWTQSEASYAREIFPCVDDPKFRCIFALTLTVPGASTALSNMPAASVVRSGGRATFAFPPTLPIPTYLFAFCYDEFDRVSDSTSRGLPVDVYSVGAADPAVFPLLICAVEFLEDFFGVELPCPRLQVAGLTTFRWGGMENFGLIHVANGILTGGRDLDTLLHELVHQWAGGITTPCDWRFLWLNEGLAQYLGQWLLDALTGSECVSRWMSRARPRFLDADTGAAPIQPDVCRDAQSLFSFLTYDKMGFVHQMVRSYMGDERWRAGLRDFYTAFHMKTATGDDLIGALAAHGECGFIAGWVLQPGYPILVLEDDGMIHQAPCSPRAAAGACTWTFPVDVLCGVGEETFAKQILVAESGPVAVGVEADWVALNHNLLAYCRVWHKGRYHRGIARAMECGRLSAVYERSVRSDIGWVVGNGIAPHRCAADLGVRDWRRYERAMPDGAKIRRFAVGAAPPVGEGDANADR